MARSAKSQLSKGLERLVAAWTTADPDRLSAFSEGLSGAIVVDRLKPWCRRPPAEVVELYGWRNGVPEDSASQADLLPGVRLLPLEEAFDQYQALSTAAEDLATGTGAEASVVWDRRWLPILHGTGGHYLVKCEPHEDGMNPVYFKDEQDPDLSIEYDSLASMIQVIAEGFATGAYRLDENGAIHEHTLRLGKIYRRLNPFTAGQALAAGDSAGQDSLVHALTRGDGSARGKAAAALMKLKDSRTVPHLIRVLDDGDVMARGFAAKVLGELKDARAVNALIAALDDADGRVRTYAGASLGRIGDRRAIRPLLDTLKKGDYRHGDIPVPSAIMALGRFRSEEAIGTLIQILESGTVPLRENAAAALGMIRDARAMQAMVRSLEDPDPQVRWTSAAALGAAKYAPATNALLKALDDPHVQVKLATVTALGKIGDPKAVAPLDKLGQAIAKPSGDAYLDSFRNAFRDCIAVALQEIDRASGSTS